MNTIRRLSLMGVLMLAFVGASPTPVLACTAPPGGLPHYTVADHVKAAGIVVEGVVVAKRDVNYLQVADIQVAQYIKGNGPDPITVDGYGPSSVCLSEVFVGQHGLFYITEDSPGVYHAFYMSQFDAIGPTDSPSIAEAIAAAGQEPVAIASADAIQFRLTEIASTPSATPTPLPPPIVYPPEAAPALTQAYATIYAAATAYQNDPITQSAHMTAAYATVDSLQVTVTPTPSFACSSSSRSIAEHTQAANVVLEGVVSGGLDDAVIVQVVQYLKLDASSFGPSVQINFTQSNACPFAPPFGSHFIFFAIGEPALVMYALDAGEYTPVASPDSATIAEIIAASGQTPVAVQGLGGIESMLTATAGATSPISQTGIAATQSMALTLAAAPLVPTPFPFPTPYLTPTPPATATEIVGLIGVGAVGGLIVGALVGIVIGLFIGRWRE